MKKKTLSAILTVVIIILLGVLGVIIILPLAKEARPTQAKILVERSVSSLPIYLAQSYYSWGEDPSDTIFKEDIFSRKSVKLEVTVDEEVNPEKAIQALSEGQAQFAVLSWPDALSWMDTHPEDTLVCFLSIEFKESRPVEGLLPKKGLKFDKITDIEGKKVGIPHGLRIPFLSVLGAVNIDPESVAIEEYSEEELLQALEGEDLDLIYLYEPYYTKARVHLSEPFAGGGFLPNWIGAPYHAAGLFTTKEYYDENKRGVLRMYLAMNHAVREIEQADADSLGAFLGSISGIDDPQLTTRIIIPEYYLVQEISAFDVQSLADRLEIYGTINTAPDLEELGVFLKQKDLKE
ncbi:hypothetical protein GF338_11290 [candidate division WOR-3 bacterium]|nr:hypothetical protein [candidate division WOR-3 bacterium]